MGYMTWEHARDEALKANETLMVGTRPVYGDAFKCFIRGGLLCGCVLDGVVADIWGPRESVAGRLGVPIYDLSSTQWLIRDYHLSHMPPDWRHAGPICVDDGDVVLLNTPNAPAHV